MRSLVLIAGATALLWAGSAKASVNVEQQFCGDRYGRCAGPAEYGIKLHIRGRRHRMIARHHRRHRHHVASPRRTISAKVSKLAPAKVHHGGKSRGLDAVISPLAAKVRSIVSDCGTRVVSAYRPGARVRGSGRPSLHSTYPARAVDLAGNPSCIYSHLKGWPGGVSTDYGSVNHVHVSYDPKGREWGVRFAHYGHGHHNRYARRHSRYASAR